MNEGEIKKQIETYEKLFAYHGEDEVLSGGDIIREIQNQPVADFKISNSGFPGLDQLTEGFEGGELIIISGPSKNGKTLFCQTLTDNFSQRTISSLWFSYELRPKQFLNRFRTVPDYIFMPKKLTQKSLDWIEARILEGIIKFGVKVVFFDHLHFLVDMEKLRNPSLELGALVRRLKGLALEYDLIFFLICHITKLKIGDEPTEADLRDSSFIYQDADSTMMVFRPENKDYAIVKVRNHRRTGTINKGVRVKMVNGLLRECSPEDPR